MIYDDLVFLNLGNVDNYDIQHYILVRHTFHLPQPYFPSLQHFIKIIISGLIFWQDAKTAITALAIIATNSYSLMVLIVKTIGLPSCLCLFFLPHDLFYFILDSFQILLLIL